MCFDQFEKSVADMRSRNDTCIAPYSVERIPVSETYRPLGLLSRFMPRHFNSGTTINGSCHSLRPKPKRAAAHAISLSPPPHIHMDCRGSYGMFCLLVLLGLLAQSFAPCPESAVGVKLWSNTATWPSGSPPTGIVRAIRSKYLLLILTI